MNKKKILSFITSAVMAAGFLSVMPKTEIFEPMTAEAASYSDEAKYGDYLYYKKVDEDEDGTYDYVRISDCDTSATSVEIPSEIDGLPVTRIGDYAFRYSESLTSITIPDSVTSIGAYAFEGCTSLTSITIPDSVTSIGDSAFKYCESLARITIPDIVTSIEDWTFYGCDLTSVTIPDSVTSIGYSAFCGCGSLTSITIPDSVTSIEERAFCICGSLESIIIENPECEIYDSPDAINNGYDDDYNSYFNGIIYGYENSTAQAYAEKYGNEFVSLGEAPVTPEEPELTAELSNIITTQSLKATIITNIEGCTFKITQEQGFGWGASEIFSVDENGVIKWEFVGGYAAGTVTITSPQGQTLDLQFSAALIDKCSFINNEIILKVGETVRLEYNATAWTSPEFSSSDESVVSVTDNTITAVAPGTAVITGTPGFDEDDIVTVTVTGNTTTPVVTITSQTTVTALVTTTLATVETGESDGDTLKYQKIDEDEDGTYDYVEITDCDTSATSVEIPSEIDGLPVTRIGDCAFYDCTSLESITIPDSVTSIGEDTFYGTALLNNQTGPLYYVDTWVVDCDSDVTSVEIKEGTKGIADEAFSECTSLESITIPDSVTSIGDRAFTECTSLESITIPDSVTSIGRGAFGVCTSLTDINVNENNFSYSSIDGILFNKEQTSIIVYPAGKPDKSYVIPDSITSIGVHAFSRCESLESITIPDSVTSIGNWAFYKCTSLVNITIPDSVISVGDRAFFECTSLVSITIGDSVTSIGEYAFGYCVSLTNITIENPECKIYDSPDTIDNGYDDDYNSYFNGTIYGYENSTAQAYAEKYGYAFDLIENAPAQTTPSVTTTVTTSTTTTKTSVSTTEPKTTNLTTAKTTTTVKTTTIQTTTATESSDSSDYLDIKENNGKIIIVNCDDLIVNVVVPSEINNMIVSKINDYAFSSESIETIRFNNPDVEITDSATTINENAVIYGYWDSTAHDYATKYDREFVSLDGEPEIEIIVGDANNDNKLTVSDAAFIARTLAKRETIDVETNPAADFNGDGKVTVSDAAAIARELAKAKTKS